MKTRQWVVTVLAAAVMGGCVVPDHPRPVVVDHYHGNPYLVGDRIDMGAPVYFRSYPEYVFYHRYDRNCDCIRIVRLVSVGGAVFWVDQYGKRVHEGHWEPVRPSPHALHGYRGWSQQHRAEFHHVPPPGHRGPPPKQPVPPPHVGRQDHGPKAVLSPQPPPAPTPPTLIDVVKRQSPLQTTPAVQPPQPVVAPVPAVRPGKPGQHGQHGQVRTPGQPGQAVLPVKPGQTQPATPAPAVQPGKTVMPAPAVQPVRPAPVVQPGRHAPTKGDAPAKPAPKKCPDDKKDC